MPPALETLYSYMLVVYFNFKGAERCWKPAINKVPAILLRSKFTQEPDSWRFPWLFLAWEVEWATTLVCLGLRYLLGCGTSSVKTGMHTCGLTCFSHVWLFVALWIVACQASLSMGFSRQEYWNGLLWPLPGGSSQLRDQTRVSYASCIGRWVLYH